MMPFVHVTCERPMIVTQVGLLGRGLQFGAQGCDESWRYRLGMP